MRTRILPATFLAIAILGCAPLVFSSAFAQARVNLPKNLAPVPHDEESPQERINRLEMTINALQSRLAADEKKLQEASDAAGQAKAGIGFINIGFGKQIEDLKAHQGSVDAYMNNTNGVIAGLGQKLDALSTRFDGHTHTYHGTFVGQHADGTISKIDYPKQTTSTPNN